jgi:hypothetical protein
MDIRFYRDAIHQHGALATLYHAAFRAVNRVTEVAVLNALVVTPDGIDTSSLPDPGRWSVRVLEAAAMRAHAGDPENALTPDFIREAGEKGDRCSALFDGDTLMSYGWYSTRPTRLMELAGSPVLHFDPSYVYMYHAYTRPSYRGRRLHAIGTAAALEAYASAGQRGLISYVDSSNLASLKSCYRIGFHGFGHLVLLRVGQRYLWRCTPGCKRHDLRVEAR